MAAARTRIKTTAPKKEEIPDKLKPFFDLGYDEERRTGSESIGTCIFCGKQKLYININTGQYSCKTGSCAVTGNIYTFMEHWHADRSEDIDHPDLEGVWDELETDRGIPIQALKDAGIVWDYTSQRWALAIRNSKAAIVNIRFYAIGKKLMGVTGLDAAMFGLEELGNKSRKAEPVYVCEGEFDTIALRLILENAEEEGIVVGVPGANIFKPAWADALAGRNTILCYDNDSAGQSGMKRAWMRLKAIARGVQIVKWPDTLPEGWDLRDFYRHDGEFAALKDLLVEYETARDDTEYTDEGLVEFPPLSEGKRPRFQKVLDIYKEYLRMSQDMQDGLRIIYAVIMSNQLPGDPLWMHLVGVPGAGKTELLMSCAEVGNTAMESSLTPKSLVSGFIMPGGKDPSLIPQLFGKTFILKDFTEILAMNKTNKDEIYAILRGAYDGRVEKPFGNGQKRHYEGYFTMLTGVTPKIYGETTTSLGERFLLFHMKHIPGADNSDVVMQAMDNSGGELALKGALNAAAKSFLEWGITEADLPQVSQDIKRRIANLAQLVAMLRATVEKEGQSDRIVYRAEYEVGTRLAKQLYKLIVSLGLLNYPAKVGEAEYQLVQRVAMDSCVGWNRDALIMLARANGKTAQEIADMAHVPLSTMRSHLENLTHLSVLHKEREKNPAGRGAPIVRYIMSDGVMRFWEGAGLPIVVKAKPKPRPAVKKLKARIASRS